MQEETKLKWLPAFSDLLPVPRCRIGPAIIIKLKPLSCAIAWQQ